MKSKYDFLIVGAGLFGSTCARILADKGYKVLVVEKRNCVGGNVFDKDIEGINVHIFGAHIFHTSNINVWEFVNRFAKFNNFVNSPLANYYGELYHLPFNMNTFVKLWPFIKNSDDARNQITDEIKKACICGTPKNLEEQAISLVGTTIYNKLIKEYTEKQWGKECRELPPFIIKRLPVRFEYNNNYFDDIFQGIPIGGYTRMVKNILDGIDVLLGTDYTLKKAELSNIADRVIYTGPIDEYYDYCFGFLEYRTLEFKTKIINKEYFQECAVVNYTSKKDPFTRIIEHKYFENKKSPITVITEEYPALWKIGTERFYTVNDSKNENLYNKYYELSKKENRVFFGGRLGMYKYFDMDDTIEHAFELVDKILG